MRSWTMIFLLGFLGILSSHTAAQADDANTRIATLPYADCLSIIAEASQELHEAPVQLINNEEETSVRINASDGFVTISCHRSTGKMVLTKSPVPEAAGMTASR
ncbi:hypothetical protein DC522_01250 [Microvirga sp. KLBC 81]|uniref:hypothetical protein n=1 Tax=Microvirga sp. KLBC 81 TaxID=1862707 RepID=UPI000D5159DE|nr:hypothetical protein [Microvirga sp. KLBC 81]PVE26418.1 hypothetical protein DC522_01250 [Microvirga sp. KLBC 81]